VLKALARAAALVLALPSLLSYAIRRHVVGADRAIEGTSQWLAQIPGIPGQYVRRAFFAQTIEHCARTAVVAYGTTLSKQGSRLDDRVYIGPGCVLGLVHIERDVLIGSGVHITSGRHTHGTDQAGVPIRDQEGAPALVRIGAGAWIGSGAIVMADVGREAIVGAGAVVTQPVPDAVVAAGVPARVIRPRAS
jgi:acetyltransferase-like isoleucine patch superfamily enzyme